MLGHGPLTRYVILHVAHAPEMTETFSPPVTSKETACQRSRHASRHVRDARAVMHVGITNPRWQGKRSGHSQRTRSPQFHVSDPLEDTLMTTKLYIVAIIGSDYLFAYLATSF